MLAVVMTILGMFDLLPLFKAVVATLDCLGILTTLGMFDLLPLLKAVVATLDCL
ncbi:hypothetical protein TorRG33x02_281030, partial [Trema orientale]